MEGINNKHPREVKALLKSSIQTYFLDLRRSKFFEKMTEIYFMKTDPLLEIFYKHLKKNNSQINDPNEFVHNVVADYIFYLMNIGHITNKACDTIEVDLKEEVYELYCKLQAGPLKKVQQTINQPAARTRRLN